MTEIFTLADEKASQTVESNKHERNRSDVFIISGANMSSQ